jgi:hypothetical protein
MLWRRSNLFVFDGVEMNIAHVLFHVTFLSRYQLKGSAQPGPFCFANCVGVIPQRSKIVEDVLSRLLRFIHTTSMFPPVCNDAPHSGTDHVAIGTMAIKACIAAEVVVDSMAMIFNRLD